MTALPQDTALTTDQRNRALAAMSGDEGLDVLVVGGGVTGAGIALDAAGRGLSRIAVGGDLDLQHALQAPGSADSSRQALAVAIAQQPVEAGLEGPIAIGEGVDHRQAAGAERLRTA